MSALDVWSRMRWLSEIVWRVRMVVRFGEGDASAIAIKQDVTSATMPWSTFVSRGIHCAWFSEEISSSSACLRANLNCTPTGRLTTINYNRIVLNESQMDCSRVNGMNGGVMNANADSWMGNCVVITIIQLNDTLKASIDEILCLHWAFSEWKRCWLKVFWSFFQSPEWNCPMTVIMKTLSEERFSMEGHRFAWATEPGGGVEMCWRR